MKGGNCDLIMLENLEMIPKEKMWLHIETKLLDVKDFTNRILFLLLSYLPIHILIPAFYSTFYSHPRKKAKRSQKKRRQKKQKGSFPTDHLVQSDRSATTYLPMQAHHAASIRFASPTYISNPSPVRFPAETIKLSTSH
jgi:hypothetical protein